MRILAAFLVCISSVSAQTPGRSEAGQRLGARESLRIERLQTLADLWGTLWLIHPYVVATNVDWDQVLIDAIPQVERAGSTEEFVEVLNKFLLRPLGDPLALVRTRYSKVGSPAGDSVRARPLGGSAGYVDLRNPELYASPTFASRLSKAVQRLGPVQSLVVDLRWQVSADPEIDAVPAWLGLWTTSRLAVGAQVSRARHGWLQREAGGQKWEVGQSSQLEPMPKIRADAGAQLAPSPTEALSAISVPTVFLVNNTAYPFIAPALDALQSQSRVAVIWEQTGPFVEEDALHFPESVEARLNTTMVLTHAGALGVAPDAMVREGIPDTQLAELARRTLLERRSHREPRRAVFSFAMRLPPSPAPISTAPLSREQRMLGLFKIRTVLGEFYPHSEYSSLDWPNLLGDWVPRVEAATSQREYYLELTRLGAGLNDSHVEVQHPIAGLVESGRAFSIPVRLGRVEGKIFVVETMLGADSLLTPVHIGDEVLAIDGRSVAEVESAYRPLISASTESAFYKVLWTYQSATRGAAESSVVLTLRSGATTRTVTLRCTIAPAGRRPPRPARETQDYFHLLDGNLGFINLVTVPDSAALDRALIALSQTEGLVMDLRGPSGFGMASTLLRMLSRTPVRGPITESRVMYGPLKSSWETYSEAVVEPDPNRHYAKPVVVLIDARAQSQPEFIGVWLRNSGRVTFVGSHTTGATGTASFIYLPGGARFSFTSQRVRYADGSRFQNIGIAPDVVVEPTIDGIRQGRDEVLEKGIDVLRRTVAGQPRQP